LPNAVAFRGRRFCVGGGTGDITLAFPGKRAAEARRWVILLAGDRRAVGGDRVVVPPEPK